MGSIIPVFESVCIGSLTASGQTNWVDICANGPDANSPIPSGKRLWVGYVTCISPDKSATFELRSNIAGQSTGTDGNTLLRGFQQVPQGESRDLDVYYGGAITTLAPATADSTGVEKLWLKIESGSSATATYEFILYYSLY